MPLTIAVDDTTAVDTAEDELIAVVDDGVPDGARVTVVSGCVNVT